ncbi:NAD-dependent succinate-semialdehyde dehydrogenase [Rhizorhabdus wittichii]
MERKRTVDRHAYPAPRLFIDGEWIDAGDRDTLPIANPATGEAIGRLPVATRADLDRALDAARRGFAVWRAKTALERAAILHRAAALLRERADEIGRLSTIEQGKLVGESIAEAQASADIFDWFAEDARRDYGRIVPSKQPSVRHLVVHEPIGPAALFTPWNFPVTIPARKLAAALAAGCSVVIKPAEETPMSCLELARALDDAGLPKGVLNVVFGLPAEISDYLIRSPVIRKVSFTGSTGVGKLLAGIAAEVMKPTTMELGGHAPVIVFDDVDIDIVVRMTAASKFRNAGQICIAPTRFYLHDRIHDAFVARFAEAARALTLGNGLDPGTRMGPLANPRRVVAMEAMIGDAIAGGAALRAGGAKGDLPGGNFWEATVLSDVPDSARIMNEEPFGPVIATQRFETIEDVAERANRLPYGLAAYAFTRSAAQAHRIGEMIEAGMVGVNFPVLTGPETPFGGVKESGHGSDGGIEALRGYQVTKYIAQGYLPG